ncbi:hypothetical protein Hanom_Chr03g00269301 [Helianthus anomalus]
MCVRVVYFKNRLDPTRCAFSVITRKVISKKEECMISRITSE